MRFHFDENQNALTDSVRQIMRKYSKGPQENGVSAAVYSSWSGELYDEMKDGGFLDVAQEDEFGPTSALLVVELAAQSPMTSEIACSALVVPHLEGDHAGPYAIVREIDLARPIRFLPVARSLIVVGEDAVRVVPVDGNQVEANGGMYAYPYGTLKTLPDLATVPKLDVVEPVLRSWQTALAAESAAAMSAALDFVSDHVRNRRQFGRPLGTFQAIKHRLAISAQNVRGSQWLARKAAWSGTAKDAALAALYVQKITQDVVYDCHQFTGAMGMTLECPLHFWTYRAKALQGELGGTLHQARRVVHSHWSN